MSTIVTLTVDELRGLLLAQYGEEVVSEVAATINRWIERNDGVAIYRNEALDHPELGHFQLVSYGSEDAQLVTDEPPIRMPDIGQSINWRYQLVATYRGSERV